LNVGGLVDTRAARVSIGLPVYNGEDTVALAIECLLAQTFGDLELVVSDNASTDATLEVVSRYAAKDRRVRVLRNRTNLGVNGNYSVVAREARGTYFKWASSNDWCAPTFLERCVAVLDERPDVVLAYPRTRLFKGSLDVAEDYDDAMNLQSESPSARVLMLLSKLRLNNVMNGVIRVSALRETRLLAPYYSSDRILTGHLALLGKFAEIPEPLFYRRMDPKGATQMRSRVELQEFFYPGRDRRMLFQNWRTFSGWLRMVLAARIAPSEKLPIVLHLMRACYWGWRELTGDVREAGRYFIGRGAR
jgi:glycosyltransferase involved in cell wall biosynthesis